MISKLLLSALLILTSSFSFSQDTTWVQTFTFDSISNRRADFTFPQELDTMRFEKVLMYYKLKCSPLTPWDGFNCGEWDYLTYSRIFDHTGVMDSVQVDSVQYLNDWNSTPSYVYEPYTGSRFNTYVRTEQNRSGATLTPFSIVSPTGTSANYPFDLSANGDRYQMIMTSSELIAAGVVAGDIESLSLFISAGGISVNGEVLYPQISIKSTLDSTLSSFHASGFTEVYNLSRTAGSGLEFVDGQNDLLFHQPYSWNGTDNLIVEFYFDRSIAATNMLLFDTEATAGDMAVHYGGRNGVMKFDGTNQALLEFSDVELGDNLTIAFWSKGLGNFGVNNSILEGYDTLNNRVINIHMPWSDNTMYWDCGAGGGYDRISKDMTGAGVDNEWHHWAFIKEQTTGTMKVLRDGVLWHSGTGLNRSVGELHRLVLGSNRNIGNHWVGVIDEFQLYDEAVDEATIAAWYNKRIDASHPYWSNLQTYYNFDETSTASDLSQNDFLLMPSTTDMINFDEVPVIEGVGVVDRVQLSFAQGTVTGPAVDVETPLLQLIEPEVVFEFSQVDNHFEIVNGFLATPSGSEDVYDAGMTLISSVPFTGSSTINNTAITYYEPAYEIVHNVEIGRFITPYGINFDLGSDGFTWVYDVTDYQQYMHGIVDLAAHNTQELIDLKFGFIEGIPPRDVHHREPIWSDYRSYSYASMDNDSQLAATQVVLSDSSQMFKVKTRFTGHGHHGSVNCCEWDSKDHMISVDGVERFNWEIWEETACGDNPNPGQGGTWPYAREGWCPGDLVKEYDHELTPYVTPGTSVEFDYDIEDVPTGDPDQGSGNFVVAMDLISYSEPNHQYDAAIIDVLNPNNWEYYGKFNPSCQNPKVILQNTGAQDLTNCTIKIWISDGNFVQYEWTGTLSFLEKEVVEIPVSDIGFWNDYHGLQTFYAQVWNVNGPVWPQLDEYAKNDVYQTQFEAPETINGPFAVQFNTNNRANENKWRLEDSDGNVIFERLSLANDTDYKDTFDLAAGCYSIILEDSDNDGIGFWYSAQVEGETTGTFRLRLIGGSFIEFFPADFGNFHRYNFSVGFTVNTEETNLDHEIIVFPNPNDGVFDIELSGFVGNEAELQIFDLLGREVFKEKMNAHSNFASSKVELLNVPAGHYLIKVVTAKGVYTKEFVKK
ncbi:MAG: hypothetical protein ACI865_001635 [Flavobacteriaceae bacterium]|jgi:hypothetical protein